jgi:transposase
MIPLKKISRSKNNRYLAGCLPDFGVKAERVIEHMPTGKVVGIDVGLKAYYTDSEGNTLENPRHYSSLPTEDEQADWMKEEPPCMYGGECQNEPILLNA